jgi:ABC-type transporter Mla subunit MlaD
MVGGAIDMTVAERAVREAAGRAAALVRTAPDGSAAVPQLTWTVADTAAHLVAEVTHYTGFVTGARDAEATLARLAAEGTPAQRNAVANAAQLAEFTERDPSRLADMLVPAVDDFIAAASRCRGGERFLTTTGIRMTVPMMTMALLGEQLIHGLDMARAADLPR